MVQIIHKLQEMYIAIMVFFISHMVQIIQLQTNIGNCYRIIFISHMVQIIHMSARILMKPRKLLYIPHGSDNTFYSA